MLRVVTALLLGAFAVVPGCACEEDLGHIPEPGAITGRVCDPGQHVAIYDARVHVEVNRGGKVEELDTFTEADGSFVLDGIPPGTYDLHVARGSFTTVLLGVVVSEGETTALDEAACLAPDTVDMTVFTGHDSVEDVLTRLGYDDFELVETNRSEGEDDESVPSWIVEAFGPPGALDDQDILFVNCDAHEWALDRASPAETEAALDALRTFVENGGSIYFSDWAYDLVEALYPDAVDWLGDDSERDDAQRGKQQDFVATVVDTDVATALGRDTANLSFDFNRIALAQDLGPTARPLLLADVRADDGSGGEETIQQVPVVLEIKPAGEAGGRILFTSFHNGANNTVDMDDVLRAIVFAL
jgi:hypothetical protein